VLQLTTIRNYYPLLIFQVGNKETATSPRAVKRDFKGLGQVSKGSGAQVVFTILPVAENDEESNKNVM